MQNQVYLMHFLNENSGFFPSLSMDKYGVKIEIEISFGIKS